MSLSPTVPMIRPDGTPTLVDRNHIQDAANSGYSTAIVLRRPTGEQTTVPMTNLHDALNNGYKTEGQYQESLKPPSSTPSQQNNDAGLVSTPMRFLKGLGGTLADAATGAFHTIGDAPTNIPESIAAMAGLLPAYRSIVPGAIDQAKQAKASAQQGDYAGAVQHGIGAAVPVIGPSAVNLANDLNSDISQGNYSGASGKVVGNLALGEAMGRGLKAAGAYRGPVPGQNYTAPQLAAHTGILGRMSGLGDNFIPQDSAETTLSPIRQAAADNPSIAQAATQSGSTPQNIAAYQAILQKANNALEIPHAATIAQHASVPADLTTVQAGVKSALPKSLAGVAPEDAAGLQELSKRLGTVRDLGGLNDLRQWLNDEAAASYKQDGVAAGRSTATKLGYRQAADAARNAYYDQLQQASGVDFRPLKAAQASLLDQQEGAAKLGQTLSAQQAVADEPKSSTTRIAEAITGGRALKAGPVAGVGQIVAEKVLGQKPLTQPNFLIRKALSDLPQPTPAQAAASAPNAPLNSTPVTPPPPMPTAGALSPPQPIGLPPTIQRILHSPPISPPPPTPVAALPSEASAGLPDVPVNTHPGTPYEPSARMRVQPTQFRGPQPIPSRPIANIPMQLESGTIDPGVKDLSVLSADDLKRAIQAMRARKAGK